MSLTCGSQERSAMLIGIVSDTHGHVLNTLEAIRVLQPFDLAAVLHCGDIGSAEIPPLFRHWPTHFVFGNVDGQEDELRTAISAAGMHCHERFAELTWVGRRIAILHGDDQRRLTQVLNQGVYDLVCSGHTHRAAERRIGRTLWLNPGAVYRASPHSVAVVDLETMSVTNLTF